MEVHQKNYDDTLVILKEAAAGELLLRKKKTRDTRPPKYTEINGLVDTFTKLFGSTEKLESDYVEDVKKNIQGIAKRAARDTLDTIHTNYKKNCESRAKNLVKFYNDMLDENKGDKEAIQKIKDEHNKHAEEFDMYVQEMILPKKEVKKKKLNFKNLVSSKVDKKKTKKTKKSEKETNPWEHAGQKPGLEIWRIEKLKVKAWAPNKYGTFYDGDTFIVLNSYYPKGTQRLQWNVHFWIGSKCSIDERTVAAYKTVELDEYLGGGPIQFREVQGHESKEFNQTFKNGIQVLSGGIESGFNPKEPEKFKPKLLHLKGKRKVRVDEVPPVADSLNSGDAFILDCGLMVYCWMGKDSGKMEKFQARQISQNFKNDVTRRGVEIVELKEDGDDDFWEILGGKPEKIKSAEEGGDDIIASKKRTHVLYKLSDSTGKIEFEKIKDGPFTKDDLDENDAFIVDCDKKVFVWIGSKASKSESKLAMVYATDYLKLHGRPAHTPLLLLKAGQQNSDFSARFK